MRRYLNSKCQDTVLFFFFLILIAKRKTVLLLKGLDSLKSTYTGDRFGEQKFPTLRKKCGDCVWRQSPYRINLSLEHVSPMNIEKEPQEAHIESTFPENTHTLLHSGLFMGLCQFSTYTAVLHFFFSQERSNLLIHETFCLYVRGC